MSGMSQPGPFCIGWDVGGWHCDKNAESRDAIVILILNASLAIVGEPWRGNLRNSINAATTSESWVQALFVLCGAVPPPEKARFTLAIDTPLGFSQAFVALVTGLKYVEPVVSSATNPYLFRQTERNLFEQGLRPLSAVKDMIGSQATKGSSRNKLDKGGREDKCQARRKPCGVAWLHKRFATTHGAWQHGRTVQVISVRPLRGCTRWPSLHRMWPAVASGSMATP